MASNREYFAFIKWTTGFLIYFWLLCAENWHTSYNIEYTGKIFVRNMKYTCYRLNICISPEFTYWNSKAQFHGIKRWGRWKVRVQRGLWHRRRPSPKHVDTNLGLSGSRIMRNKFLLFISPSICGILL